MQGDRIPGFSPPHWRSAVGWATHDHGEIRQRDTYFAVERGGLKLREETPPGSTIHLIQFPSAASEPQQRESRYRISLPMSTTQGKHCAPRVDGCDWHNRGGLQDPALFLWRHVRIHLDTVERLGNFIEIEAAGPDWLRLGRGVCASPDAARASRDHRRAADPARVRRAASSARRKRMIYLAAAPAL